VGRFKAALGVQDQLAEFMSRAFATASLSNTVGVLPDKAGGIGHGHTQANAPNDRQVWQIVTQISDLFIA
jgi:hypothetical protein